MAVFKCFLIIEWKLFCNLLLCSRLEEAVNTKGCSCVRCQGLAAWSISLAVLNPGVTLMPYCFFSLEDVPKDQRLQAVQAAIMLMSDENREVLQTLLCFLSDVTSVEENQMTPMNIAVCLAPSLFHLNILKENLSPRYTYTLCSNCSFFKEYFAFKLTGYHWPVKWQFYI